MSAPHPSQSSGAPPASDVPPPPSVGLTNFGNSCYINGSLQALAHVPRLVHIILDTSTSSSDEPRDRHAYELLRDCVLSMHYDTPHRMTRVARLRAYVCRADVFHGEYVLNRQEDAQAFIQHCLQGVLAGAPTITTTVQCECAAGHRSERTPPPSVVVQVELDELGDNARVDLGDLTPLREVTEELTGDNQFRCTQCEEEAAEAEAAVAVPAAAAAGDNDDDDSDKAHDIIRVNATRTQQRVAFGTSGVLLLQLNRFAFTQQVDADGAFVRHDNVIVMLPDAKKTVAVTAPVRLYDGQRAFRLRASVHHHRAGAVDIDTMRSGHYVALAYAADGRVVEYNDQRVSGARELTVTDHKTSYVLVYELDDGADYRVDAADARVVEWKAAVAARDAQADLEEAAAAAAAADAKAAAAAAADAKAAAAAAAVEAAATALAEARRRGGAHGRGTPKMLERCDHDDDAVTENVVTSRGLCPAPALCLHHRASSADDDAPVAWDGCLFAQCRVCCENGERRPQCRRLCWQRRQEQVRRPLYMLHCLDRARATQLRDKDTNEQWSATYGSDASSSGAAAAAPAAVTLIAKVLDDVVVTRLLTHASTLDAASLAEAVASDSVTGTDVAASFTGSRDDLSSLIATCEAHLTTPSQQRALLAYGDADARGSSGVLANDWPLQQTPTSARPRGFAALLPTLRRHRAEVDGARYYTFIDACCNKERAKSQKVSKELQAVHAWLRDGVPKTLQQLEAKTKKKTRSQPARSSPEQQRRTVFGALLTEWARRHGDARHPLHDLLLDVCDDEPGGDIAWRLGEAPAGEVGELTTETPFGRFELRSDAALTYALRALTDGAVTSLAPVIFSDAIPYERLHVVGEAAPARGVTRAGYRPGSEAYEWHAASTYFAFLLVSSLRRICFVSCLGVTAQQMVFGKDKTLFAQSWHDQKLERDRDTGHAFDGAVSTSFASCATLGPAAPPSFKQHGVAGALLLHNSAIAHQFSDPQFATTQRVQTRVAFQDMCRVAALVDEQLAAGVLRAYRGDGAGVTRSALIRATYELLSPLPKLCATRLSFGDAVLNHYAARETKYATQHVPDDAEAVAHRQFRGKRVRSKEDKQAALYSHRALLHEVAPSIACTTPAQRRQQSQPQSPQARSYKRMHTMHTRGALLHVGEGGGGDDDNDDNDDDDDIDLDSADASRLVLRVRDVSHSLSQLVTTTSGVIGRMLDDSYAVQKLCKRAHQEHRSTLTGVLLARLQAVAAAMCVQKEQPMQACVLTFLRDDCDDEPADTQCRVHGVEHVAGLARVSNRTVDADDGVVSHDVTEFVGVWRRRAGTYLDCLRGVGCQQTHAFLASGAVVVSFNERGGQCVGLASGGGASAQKKKKTKNKKTAPSIVGLLTLLRESCQTLPTRDDVRDHNVAQLRASAVAVRVADCGNFSFPTRKSPLQLSFLRQTLTVTTAARTPMDALVRRNALHWAFNRSCRTQHAFSDAQSLQWRSRRLVLFPTTIAVDTVTDDNINGVVTLSLRLDADTSLPLVASAGQAQHVTRYVKTFLLDKRSQPKPIELDFSRVDVAGGDGDGAVDAVAVVHLRPSGTGGRVAALVMAENAHRKDVTRRLQAVKSRQDTQKIAVWQSVPFTHRRRVQQQLPASVRHHLNVHHSANALDDESLARRDNAYATNRFHVLACGDDDDDMQDDDDDDHDDHDDDNQIEGVAHRRFPFTDPSIRTRRARVSWCVCVSPCVASAVADDDDADDASKWITCAAAGEGKGWHPDRFHKTCVGLSAEAGVGIDEDAWYCPSCVDAMGADTPPHIGDSLSDDERAHVVRQLRAVRSPAASVVDAAGATIVPMSTPETMAVTREFRHHQARLCVTKVIGGVAGRIHEHEEDGEGHLLRGVQATVAGVSARDRSKLLDSMYALTSLTRHARFTHVCLRRLLEWLVTPIARARVQLYKRPDVDDDDDEGDDNDDDAATSSHKHLSHLQDYVHSVLQTHGREASAPVVSEQVTMTDQVESSAANMSYASARDVAGIVRSLLRVQHGSDAVRRSLLTTVAFLRDALVPVKTRKSGLLLCLFLAAQAGTWNAQTSTFSFDAGSPWRAVVRVYTASEFVRRDDSGTTVSLCVTFPGDAVRVLVVTDVSATGLDAMCTCVLNTTLTALGDGTQPHVAEVVANWNVVEEPAASTAAAAATSAADKAPARKKAKTSTPKKQLKRKPTKATLKTLKDALDDTRDKLSRLRSDRVKRISDKDDDDDGGGGDDGCGIRVDVVDEELAQANGALVLASKRTVCRGAAVSPSHTRTLKLRIHLLSRNGAHSVSSTDVQLVDVASANAVDATTTTTTLVVSAHELLLLRAAFSLYPSHGVVSGRFHADAALDAERLTALKSLGEYLMCHVHDWYFSPHATVGDLNAHAQSEASRSADGRFVSLAELRAAHAVADARRVLMPVALNACTEYVPEGVAAERGARRRAASMAKKTVQQQAAALAKQAAAQTDARNNGLHSDVALFAGVADVSGASPHGVKDAFSNVNWYRNSLQAVHSESAAPSTLRRRYLQNRLTFAAVYAVDDSEFDVDATIAADRAERQAAVDAAAAEDAARKTQEDARATTLAALPDERAREMQKLMWNADAADQQKEDQDTLEALKDAEVVKRLEARQLLSDKRLVKVDKVAALCLHRRGVVAVYDDEAAELWLLTEAQLDAELKRGGVTCTASTALKARLTHAYAPAREADTECAVTSSQCQSAMRRLAGALKAHDHRSVLLHSQRQASANSSPVSVVDWLQDDDTLLLDAVTRLDFEAKPSSAIARTGIKVSKTSLIWLTACGRRVVSDGVAAFASTGTTTLTRLSSSLRHVCIVGFEYPFPSLPGRRQRFLFAGRQGHYVNLRPGDTTSVLGQCFRSGLRMLLDMMSGELTYSPKSGFTMHSGLVSKRCAVGVTQSLVARAVRAPVPAKRTAPQKNDVDGIVAEFKYIDKCIARERVARQMVEHQRRCDADDEDIFDPVAHWTEPTRLYRRLLRTCALPSPAHRDDGIGVGVPAPPSSQPLPSSSTTNPAPVATGERCAWFKGIPNVPASLRHWDPGVDASGVPWLSVTRHTDAQRTTLDTRAEASPLLRGRHGFGADPNIKSFYDAYLSRTGCVVDIGRGWAQRTYDGVGRIIRRHQSTRDRLLQHELARVAQQPDMTMDKIRMHVAQCKEQWLADPQHAYRVAQDAVDAAWATIRKDQARLHEVTCIFMTAFDDRVLPWLDTGQLLRDKGVDALSHANKLKLQFLAHGTFRQRLISHCGDPCHGSNRIVWTTEEYSSKLCGRCHRYCGYLGSSRTFKCPHEDCGAHTDRDGNAARNIWMWAWLRAAAAVSGGDGDKDGGDDGGDVVASKSKGGDKAEQPDRTRHRKKRHKTTDSGSGDVYVRKGRASAPPPRLPSCTLTAFGVKALLASFAD
jgi:hypothetical protein